ncbi:hypothetical protein VNO77_20886 [Canavalia gladiata]|uniref:RING-type domain-containing protein n=1 Tax=Canavalia gladiata TaxID=3824 RepID=A0AAN9QJS0_CANGL
MLVTIFQYISKVKRMLVYLTVIATADCRVKLWRLWCELYRDFFEEEDFVKNFTKILLKNVGIVPQTFFNGYGCDMIDKLSGMLRALTLQCRGVDTDYMCVFIMVSKGCCFYNIVSDPYFFYTQKVPSRELVRRMAWEGGEFSLPAGSATLRRVVVQDKEESCAICLEGFNSGHASRLPCSHICHADCIQEWFVQNGTCPLCRFPCNRPSCYRYD